MTRAARSLPATFMRGGTSRGVLFRRDDLPEDRADWAEIFLSVMGSPDENRRQLDGMGGGISSLSKVCVIGAPTHPEADIDYTFAQVGVATADVEYAGACGNMSSAVGPFAVLSGLVAAPEEGEVALLVHDTNTGKLIRTRFGIEGGLPAVTGDTFIDGVAGSGAPVWLDFLDPAGSRTGKLFPTGQRTDTLGGIPATLADVASPCVFVAMESLGLDRLPSPDEIAADTALTDRLETLRREAALRMGLAETREGAPNSIPRIGIVAAPAEARTLSGRVLAPGNMDLGIRMMSMSDPHRAVPVTAALCLAAMVRIPGTVPAGLASSTGAEVRLAHPSGITVAAADVSDAQGEPVVRSTSLVRTTRRLFDGQVFW